MIHALTVHHQITDKIAFLYGDFRLKDNFAKMLEMQDVKQYGFGCNDSVDEGSSNSKVAATMEQTFCVTQLMTGMLM